MATSKTLTPTNVTIQIPEFTDQPDQRVNSNCIDKEADAINALNAQIADLPDYSTTEKKIGTWTDGSALYRIVYAIGSITAGTGKMFDLPTSALNKVKSMKGIVYTGTGGTVSQVMPLPFYANDYSYRVLIYANSNIITVASFGYDVVDGSLVVEYIK